MKKRRRPDDKDCTEDAPYPKKSNNHVSRADTVLDRLHTDVLDEICSFLSVHQVLQSIVLLNHKFYDFVRFHTVSIWRHHTVILGNRSRNNPMHQLLGWSQYVTRIQRLKVFYPFDNSLGRSGSTFRVQFHFFLELAAPRLRHLEICGFDYEKPLAYYPFQQLQYLRITDSVPLVFCSFLSFCTRTVRHLVIENDAVTWREPSQSLISAMSPAHRTFMLMHQYGWDWSLVHFTNIRTLRVSDFKSRHSSADDDPNNAKDTSSFLIHTIRVNHNTLERLQFSLPIVGKASQDALVSALSLCKCLKHLEIIHLSDMVIPHYYKSYNAIVPRIPPCVRMLRIGVPCYLPQIMQMLHHVEPAPPTVRILCFHDHKYFTARIPIYLISRISQHVEEIRLDCCFVYSNPSSHYHLAPYDTLVGNASAPIVIPHSQQLHTVMPCVRKLYMRLHKRVDDMIVWGEYFSFLSQCFPCLEELMLCFENVDNTKRYDIDLSFLFVIMRYWKHVHTLVVTGIHLIAGNIQASQMVPDVQQHPLRTIHLETCTFTPHALLSMAFCFAHVSDVHLYQCKKTAVSETRDHCKNNHHPADTTTHHPIVESVNGSPSNDANQLGHCCTVRNMSFCTMNVKDYLDELNALPMTLFHALRKSILTHIDLDTRRAWTKQGIRLWHRKELTSIPEWQLLKASMQ